jgi:hypothetical protein
MTTPGSDPSATVPQDPATTPEEAAAQAAQQAAAEATAATAEQIRQLATEIAKQTLMSFDPCTLRKGIVVSVQDTAAPPTLTVTISGDTLEIPGVVYYEHYDPKVSDVVHLIKQGTDLAAIGKVAEQHTETDFTDVTLAAGFTHNGNSNGNLQIRRVWDHGQWRVDIIGGVNRSSGTLVATLPANYRPITVTRRTLLGARDANGANTVKIDVGNDGTMVLVGGTTSAASTDLGSSGSTTPNNNDHFHTGTTSVTTPNDSTHQHPSHTHNSTAVDAGASSHNHSGAVSTVSHSHPTHDHSITGSNAGDSTHNHGGHEHGISVTSHDHGPHNHTIGTHSHAVTDPIWISFNLVSYFL